MHTRGINVSEGAIALLLTHALSWVMIKLRRDEEQNQQRVREELVHVYFEERRALVVQQLQAHDGEVGRLLGAQPE